jgi:hypothetical protein
MAYVSSAATPSELTRPRVSTTGVASRGLWRRIFDAMVAARRLQADREIALYLDSVGGKFTDDAERVIEQRFLSDRHW